MRTSRGRRRCPSANPLELRLRRKGRSKLRPLQDDLEFFAQRCDIPASFFSAK
jgi:hypothetical protein